MIGRTRFKREGDDMNRRIDVRVDRHPRGLLYAHSADLTGLLVIDRSRERIADALPGAIKELLEHEHLRGAVEVSELESDRRDGIVSYEAIARTYEER
jgi:hypothetical protein